MEWDLIMDGFGRLEGPCFDLSGRLCLVDRAAAGRVLRIEADGSITELAERSHVGGLVPHREGGLIATGHSVTWLVEGQPQRVLLESGTGWGFNDLGTDSSGRVYVGRFDVDPMPPASGEGGSLWRIAREGALTQFYEGIKLTNGIGVSSDDKALYHNDTGARVVWVSDLVDDGIPVRRRPLYRFEHENPDGLAMDEADCVWVALMGSGRVVRLTPRGVVDQAFEGPSKWTASLCFNGRDLYAVTFGGAPYDADRSGGIYRAQVDVAGAPIHPAQV